MASTIKDVAKLAGVSPSTVTRVLQDKSSISDATKKKVRQAMETLNYHPNVNARSLASNKTNVIGVVLPEDSDAFYQNSFFPEVIRGIAQIAARHVHRNGNRAVFFVQPRADIRAGGSPHVFVKAGNKTVFFKHGNKFARRYNAFSGRMPPRKCFRTDKLTGF